MKYAKSILAALIVFVANLAQDIHARLFAYMGQAGLLMHYTMADLQRYDVNAPGNIEQVRQRFYDFQVYPTAGIAQLVFFALPIGQGLSSSPGNANNIKTKADTNMQVAGALPSPLAFIVESIEVIIYAGTSAAANTYLVASPSVFAVAAAAGVANQVGDIFALGAGGFLDFFIGSKSYLTDASIGCFPPKTYFGLDAATASNSATVGEIAQVSGKWMGRPYYLDPPMTLRATQNFNVTLNWPVVIATPSGFNARIGVALDGVLFRNAQ